MQRRLYRSRRNRVLLGVCGGIGEYFNIDPVIFRILFVVVTLIPPFIPGLLAYFIIALIVPLEGSAAASPRDSLRDNVSEIKDTAATLQAEVKTAFAADQTKTASGRATTEPAQPSQPHHSNKLLYLLGIAIIAIGVLVLLGNLFGWLWLWPIFLIAIGLAIVLLVSRRPPSS